MRISGRVSSMILRYRRSWHNGVGSHGEIATDAVATHRRLDVQPLHLAHPSRRAYADATGRRAIEFGIEAARPVRSTRRAGEAISPGRSPGGTDRDRARPRSFERTGERPIASTSAAAVMVCVFGMAGIRKLDTRRGRVRPETRLHRLVATVCGRSAARPRPPATRAALTAATDSSLTFIDRRAGTCAQAESALLTTRPYRASSSRSAASGAMHPPVTLRHMDLGARNDEVPAGANHVTLGTQHLAIGRRHEVANAVHGEHARVVGHQRIGRESARVVRKRTG